MELPDLKKFLRILTLVFLGLFAGLYALGFIPAGAKEVFLSFVRPSDFDSFITKDLYIQSVKIAVFETWTAPRIIIPRIAVDSLIVLPTTQDPATLNAGLLKGVVRYPGSAMPGKTGNVLLFGHSTTLQAHNIAYKVFNRLKELKPGDGVAIRSDTREYLYRVRGVEIRQANDARIDLTSNKKLLTLSTCNIIGGKESRYVVTAEFVESYPLAR